MKIILNYKNKKIEIKDIKKVKKILGKMNGLMFKSQNTNALLFEFKKQTKASIHSLFVFFPFLAIWLDDKNKIIEKRAVMPFTFSVKPKKEFTKLLEIPINSKYSKVINTFQKDSSINRKV